MIFGNSGIRSNLVYQAESILDNVGGYQSPFGSSYLEGASFSSMILFENLHGRVSLISARGSSSDVVDALASHGLHELSSMVGTRGAFAVAARARVVQRSLLFHERYLPNQFMRENEREWSRLSSLCKARLDRWSYVTEPQYPFRRLLKDVAAEWLDESLPLGNASSFKHVIKIYRALQIWAQQDSESSAAERPDLIT